MCTNKKLKQIQNKLVSSPKLLHYSMLHFMRLMHDASPDHPNYPTHITATIDYDEEAEANCDYDPEEGVMHDYTKAIHSQLQAETNRKKPVADKWMLKYLKGRIFVVVGRGCSIIMQLAHYTLQ